MLEDIGRPPRETQPWEWAERNVVTPLSSSGARYDTGKAIFLRRIFESFKDEEVRVITTMCSAQSGKTEGMLALVLWAIAEDPGPMLWVMGNRNECEKMMKGRLLMQMEMCAPVSAKLPTKRGLHKQLEIYFPGAPFIMAGSEQRGALQSTPFRYLLLDEVRQYKKGVLEMIEKRVRSYAHSYKMMLISTPDMQGDHHHQSFLDGSQEHWHVPCRKCGHEQELRWGEKDKAGGLKFDVLKNEDGTYNFDAIDATVHYECEKCAEHYYSYPQDRVYLSTHGRWIAANPNAPKNHVSFHWNALLPRWADWRMQVREFLKSRAALKSGDHQAFKDHWNQTRGLPWDNNLKHAADEKLIRGRMGDYNVNDPKPDGARRFGVFDVQGKGGRHYWALCQEWQKGGSSKVLAYERLWSKEEIKAFQAKWGIDDDNMILDAAHYTAEVYQMVVESGHRWKPFRGDEKPFFLHAGRQQVFSVTEVDPAIGTVNEGRVRPIRLFLWSKPSALDRLGMMMTGQLGNWQIPKDIGSDFVKQVTAWERREIPDSRGALKQVWYNRREGQDHAADVCQMGVIAATLTGMLGD